MTTISRFWVAASSFSAVSSKQASRASRSAIERQWISCDTSGGISGCVSDGAAAGAAAPTAMASAATASLFIRPLRGRRASYEGSAAGTQSWRRRPRQLAPEGPKSRPLQRVSTLTRICCISATAPMNRRPKLNPTFTIRDFPEDLARIRVTERRCQCACRHPNAQGDPNVTNSNNFKRGALKGSTALSAVAVLGAGLAGSMILATPAFAQDDTQASPAVTQAPAAPAAESQGEIIVTGSRIPQPNLTSSAPVTVVSSQDIKLQGTTRVEDLLNSLPQVSAGQTGGESNAATGIATVDLRGLGSVRTLVLVNGRRLLPGDPVDSSADLNAIPDALIKRVEVLTGGASSTYGADAVAGVVNFIMDTDFSGIRLDSQYSFYQHNNNNSILPPLLDARIAAGFQGYEYPKGSSTDGGQINATLTIGAGFDDNRGHVTGYFGYRKVNAVTQNKRDYSACTLQNLTATTLRCGGSATSAEGNVLIFNNDVTTGTSTFFTFGPNRTLNPGVTRYNFAPTNYFQRPDERYTGGFFAHYDVNDAIKPYMEFMFMDDRTKAQIAPSGDFGNTNTINCDNPLMSAQQKAAICRPENYITGFLGNYPLVSANNPDPDPPINFIDPTTGLPYNKAYFTLLRRNVEGGPRIADLQHTEYRGVVGTKGDLGTAWSYDAYYQYGRTVYSQTYLNEFSIARLNRALDVVAGPGGTPVCRSALSGEDPLCVPYDIFGTPSAAAVGYLSATGFQRANISEQVASGSITGRLGEYGIQTPWADEGLAINVGAEYRKESLDLNTDQEFSTGDLTGQGAPTKPVKGSFNVKEFFGEFQLPIVLHSTFEELSINGGYRYSKYKVSNGNSFSTDTYKLAAEFAPVRDIRFRASYNRAVRAPNIQELFAPQIVALDGSSDPCSGFEITAADVGCLAQGLHVGQTVAGNPAGQYNGFIGGTPDLKPEKATTKTIGVVLQPRFLPRFALTVDAYDIKVKDAVQGFGADAIVNNCAATASPISCALVHRNPVSGSLWLTPDGYIIDLNQNIGWIKTRGIDVSAAYSHEIGGIGTLGLSVQGTYLDQFKINNGLTQPYDCAGYYGVTCSQGQGGSAVPTAPNPHWRHKARATFNMTNGIGLSLQWRYFGGVKVDYSNPSETTAGAFDEFARRIKAQNYFDLTATYALGDHFNFRAGVNNIFDRDPPLIT